MASPSSLRPAREGLLALLAVLAVGLVGIPLWCYLGGGDLGFAKWTPERVSRLFLGPEQLACYACFLWATLVLTRRHLEVRRQRKAFGLELIPPGVFILPEDARLLQRRVDQQVGERGPFLLANLFKLALSKFAVSRSGRDVGETVKTQSELDMTRMVSSMSLVNYLAWAIPAIGFLGTVRGLAGSLTLGGETKKAVALFIKEATGHLNVAFDCTLIALALSLALMFLLHLQQREEESLVLDCQQAALEQLVARLWEAGPEGDAPPGRDGALTEPAAPSRRWVS
jgi:hypothetical protein